MKTISKTGWYLLFSSALALGLLQLGCTVLPQEKPLRMFMLPMQSPGASSTDAVPLPLQLRVRSLQASGIVASPRIAVVPQENEVTVYRGVRWTEPAPILIRDRLIEAFKSKGRLQAVYNETNRLRPDVELSGELNVFQSEYIKNRIQVRIQVDFHITDPGGRELLVGRRFEITEASEGESIEEVVASFGRAGDQLSQEVVDWVLSEIAESLN